MPVVCSFSDVEHCQKKNDAESISHCLCYARTLVFQGRVCVVLQFLQVPLNERGGRNTMLALTFAN